MESFSELIKARRSMRKFTEEKKLNTKPQPQKWCTQEERQEAYDNWKTGAGLW